MYLGAMHPQTEADLVSEGLLNSLSVIFGISAGRKLTVTHFNSAHKSVCVLALKCVLESLPQIKSTCNDIAKGVLDIGEICCDIQKELDVYKDIMNKHSENFSKASTLISEIKPLISKIEHCYVTSSDTLNQSQEQHVQQLQEIQRAMGNQPKSEPPVLDYAEIAAHLPQPPAINYAEIAALLPKPHPPVMNYAEIAALLPKPQPPVFDYAQIAAHLPTPSQPPKPPTQPQTANIRKQMKKTSDELQKRNNVMIYGLSNVDSCTVKKSVLKMFNECGVQGISSSVENVVSAHVVSSDNARPAIRVVMSNQFIVSEILAVARELKDSAYSRVYLSRDRTPEEQERHKKCVDEMKKKLHDYPLRRWAIVGGAVVDKGSFVK